MSAALVNEDYRLPNVAIVGQPNVGKSALFNRLVGRKIAIVHDQPGITRDRLSGTCTRGERPFTLWDTGGIFGAGESELIQQVRHAVENALREGGLSAAGESELIQQVRDAVENALRESDLLLFVLDGKEGLSPLDKELARMLRKSQKPIVLAINKIDNEKHDPLAAEFDSLGFDKIISVSAEHGRGISELLDIIEPQLPPPVKVEHPTFISRSRSEGGPD